MKTNSVAVQAGQPSSQAIMDLRRDVRSAGFSPKKRRSEKVYDSQTAVFCYRYLASKQAIMSRVANRQPAVAQ